MKSVKNKIEIQLCSTTSTVRYGGGEGLWGLWEKLQDQKLLQKTLKEWLSGMTCIIINEENREQPIFQFNQQIFQKWQYDSVCYTYYAFITCGGLVMP